MVLINSDSREINCKIVYYGPGKAGKSTNLRYIHKMLPSNAKSELLTYNSSEFDRDLCFDFTPPDLDQLKGFQVRLHLYTIPGSVLYERTRVSILTGADGVIFVADSQPQRLRENVQSLQELIRALQTQGKNFQTLPIVLQYSKRDLPTTLPIETLDHYLNSFLNRPRFEAIPTRGEGVFETLTALKGLLIPRLEGLV